MCAYKRITYNLLISESVCFPNETVIENKNYNSVDHTKISSCFLKKNMSCKYKYFENTIKSIRVAENWRNFSFLETFCLNGRIALQMYCIFYFRTMNIFCLGNYYVLYKFLVGRFYSILIENYITVFILIV